MVIVPPVAVGVLVAINLNVLVLTVLVTAVVAVIVIFESYPDTDGVPEIVLPDKVTPAGSEFDVVIMVIPQSSPMLLTRNLLYTGITRAKEMLIIIGNDRIVEFMIKNVDSKKRNTGLEYKMRQ